jgi:murein DD-endopeptidase MepM/ murein hydrolase activator NlpD
MLSENSFDPRSWGKQRNSPLGAQDTIAPALPDAWKQVVDSTGMQSLDAEPHKPRTRGYILTGIAATCSLAAGGWYWQNSTAKPLAEEAVTAGPLVSDQASAEPGAVLSSRRLVLAKPGDLREALRAAGLPADVISAVDKAALSVLGSAKGQIQAVLDLTIKGKVVQLDRLEASLPDGSGAIVAKDSDGAWKASRVAAELTKQIKVVRGELDSESFYSSAVTAGVVDTLIPEFINAFTYDFNLASEVAAGDTFEVAYEQTVNAEGQPIGMPQLLFASLVTATKSRALYRFKQSDQEVGWFDGNGASSQRGLMRTPVDGARITSKFGMRFHPTLHYSRLHAGVDFGVPIGTPVYAAADGVVIGATPTGCGGNMAVLQHDNGWVTRYFHLNEYAPGLKNGQRVTQGYTIGLSGTTGTCTTGPHLHYELRVEGEPVDPMSIKTESGRKGLEGAAIAAFLQQRDRVDVARARQIE